MAKVIRLEDFGKEIRTLPKIITDKQKFAVLSGIFNSVNTLVMNSPVDTGQYASSWDVEILKDKIILGNFAPHAPVIELGARPFTPPLGPLLAWAKRVLGSGSQPPEYDKEVWGLALGVQRKIAREGIKPRHVLRESLPSVIDNILMELNKIG